MPVILPVFEYAAQFDGIEMFTVYMLRPGYIQPTKGLKNTSKMYKMITPFYPVWNLRDYRLFLRLFITNRNPCPTMIHIRFQIPQIFYIIIKLASAAAAPAATT